MAEVELRLVLVTAISGVDLDLGGGLHGGVVGRYTHRQVTRGGRSQLLLLFLLGVGQIEGLHLLVEGIQFVC